MEKQETWEEFSKRIAAISLKKRAIKAAKKAARKK